MVDDKAKVNEELKQLGEILKRLDLIEGGMKDDWELTRILTASLFAFSTGFTMLGVGLGIVSGKASTGGIVIAISTILFILGAVALSIWTDKRRKGKKGERPMSIPL